MLIRGGSTGNGIAWGKALRNASNVAPILTQQGFGTAPDATNADWTASTQASVWSVLSSNTLGPPVSSNVATLELDWGYWNKADIQVSTLQDGTLNATAPSDALWAVFRPATRPTSGTLSYSSGSAYLLITSDSSSSAPSVDMNFDVDFSGTGVIDNGSLTVNTGSNTWEAEFEGTLSGAYADIDVMSGTRGATPLNLTTSRIGGVFVGTSDANVPAFLGGFALEAGSNFIQGMTVLTECGSCDDE